MSLENPRTYQRWGDPYLMRLVLTSGGTFLSGYEVYSYILRCSDGAFFNFYEYTNNPTGSNVWATYGSFPGDLTRLRGTLTEYKIGTISLYYGLQFNFPENIENDNIETYQIFYYNPGALGLIGSEEIVYHPKTMSFNIYEAQPVTQGQISTIIS